MPSAWCLPPERDGRLAGLPRTSGSTPAFPDHHGQLKLRRGPVVVLVDERNSVCARPASLAERLQSHLFGHGLDRALAAGACPEGQVLLALRAQQLASPAVRQETARCVGRLLEADAAPRQPYSAASWLQRQRVETARPELERLRDTLASPVPISVRGVAMVRVLLTDGGGPLFWAGARPDLRTVVTQAITELSRSPLDGPAPL